jgi:hypothetical protein
MSKPVPNPRRLWRLSTDEDSLHLANIFRTARASTEGDLPRLHWRLRYTLKERAARPKRLLRLALTVGLIFVAGGSVMAALHPYWHRMASATPPRPESPQTVRARARRATVPKLKVAVPETPPVEVPATAPPERAVEVEPATKPLAARHVVPRPVSEPMTSPRSLPEPLSPPVPALAPPEPPPLSPIAMEQALLGGAVKALRKQGDPRAALAMLEDHARRFPGSVFAQDASMLRVEALLDLARNREALSVMDLLSLRGLPNRNARQVLRGELRASAGRWREARADFESVLADFAAGRANATARDVTERALWGRAASRSHLGDEPGARADLALYLRTFPNGRFAAQATALLGEGPRRGPSEPSRASAEQGLPALTRPPKNSP